MIRYTKLSSKRWNDFKEIRLNALKNDWISFGIAYINDLFVKKVEGPGYWKKTYRTSNKTN